MNHMKLTMELLNISGAIAPGDYSQDENYSNLFKATEAAAAEVKKFEQINTSAAKNLAIARGDGHGSLCGGCSGGRGVGGQDGGGRGAGGGRRGGGRRGGGRRGDGRRGDGRGGAGRGSGGGGHYANKFMDSFIKYITK